MSRKKKVKKITKMSEVDILKEEKAYDERLEKKWKFWDMKLDQEQKEENQKIPEKFSCEEYELTFTIPEDKKDEFQAILTPEMVERSKELSEFQNKFNSLTEQTIDIKKRLEASKKNHVNCREFGNKIRRIKGEFIPKPFEEYAEELGLKEKLEERGMLEKKEIIENNELEDNKTARENANRFKFSRDSELSDNEASRNTVNTEINYDNNKEIVNINSKDVLQKSHVVGKKIMNAAKINAVSQGMSMDEIFQTKENVIQELPYDVEINPNCVHVETLKPSTDKIERVQRVDHPDYYNLKDGPYVNTPNGKVMIECIDVIRDMPTWKGNVIKYLWRCGEKQELGLTAKEKELEDMKKALWYLEDKIKDIETNIK